MLPPLLTPHGVAVQHMHAPLPIHGLRLLVRQPGSLRDLKRHYTRRVRAHALIPFFQIGYHVARPVPPYQPVVIRVRVADIVVISSGVRAGLLLVLGIQRVVPARVVDEGAVYPGCVQAPGAVVEAVDVRVVGYAFEVRA